jgi:hypothetical protein
MKKKLTKRQKDAINAAKQHSMRKSVTLAQPTDWDLGPRTAAQDRLKVVEPVTQWDEAKQREVPNPNGVKRARRQPWVEVYAKQGKLTQAQRSAAETLYKAYAGHPDSDPLAAIGDVVDCQRHTDKQSATVDARRKFRAMWKKLPLPSRFVVEHVVLNDRSLRSMPGRCNAWSEDRYLERLRAGLDIIA